MVMLFNIVLCEYSAILCIMMIITILTIVSNSDVWVLLVFILTVFSTMYKMLLGWLWWWWSQSVVLPKACILYGESCAPVPSTGAQLLSVLPCACQHPKAAEVSSLESQLFNLLSDFIWEVSPSPQPRQRQRAHFLESRQATSLASLALSRERAEIWLPKSAQNGASRNKH